jgi:hypothetical protein
MTQIYVETRIHGPLDEIWRLTQDPDQHQRWDLRFTSIRYLDCAPADETQRFRYATRLAPGLQIEGWGEMVGERNVEGPATSALRFGSQDRRSLIRAGSGYWRYAPTDDGVRFITGYDYEVRWGRAGRALDRFLLRPLMGRATAWSFDRLRLWIEEGIEPGQAARQTLIHGLAAVALAFIWIWHGLVPKLLLLHADEVAILAEAGLPAAWLSPAAYAVGLLELLFGLAFIPLAHRRWPWLLTMGLMIAATAGVLVNSPQRAGAAFGPVTLNLAVAVLAAIGLLSLSALPSARRCLRRPPQSTRSDQ